MDSTVFVGPLAECDQKLHLITRSKVREFTTTHQGIHVKENALLSTFIALILVENEPILCSEQIQK